MTTNQPITFGRAFAVGILITVVSCTCYVVVWLIAYYFFIPDFVDRYAAYLVEKARASGASQQTIAATLQEMDGMKVMLANPLINAAVTFTEPFPVGLLVTLISAAVLRKKATASEARATEARA